MARCFVAVALLAVSWLVSGASNSYAAPVFYSNAHRHTGGTTIF